MRRVLVTGAGGMLGTELLGTLGGVTDVVGRDVGDFDVTDPEATLDAVRSIAPDVVVNCAGYTDVDGAESHEDFAFAVNAAGAGHLARAAREARAYFLHMSTDYVFDGSKRSPYTESDDPRPINAYGRSKLAGERAVAEAGGRSLIVRTAWLYGRAGRNFVDTMLGLAAQGGPLRVVDDQVGPPTSARDLAVMLSELIPSRATGVVHATNSGHCSWHTLARTALDLSGFEGVDVRPVPSSEFPRPAERPRYSVLALDAFVSIVGWRPRAWDDALREYLCERR